MKKKLDIDNPIDADGDFKLLENRSINDRSLICWYNIVDKTYNLSIFHISEQPNELSKRSPYTTWGYMTYAASDMATATEAAEVVGLYLQDIESDNCWWELG